MARSRGIHKPRLSGELQGLQTFWITQNSYRQQLSLSLSAFILRLVRRDWQGHSVRQSPSGYRRRRGNNLFLWWRFFWRRQLLLRVRNVRAQRHWRFCQSETRGRTFVRYKIQKRPKRKTFPQNNTFKYLKKKIILGFKYLNIVWIVVFLRKEKRNCKMTLCFRLSSSRNRQPYKPNKA